MPDFLLFVARVFDPCKQDSKAVHICKFGKYKYIPLIFSSLELRDRLDYLVTVQNQQLLTQASSDTM